MNPQQTSLSNTFDAFDDINLTSNHTNDFKNYHDLEAAWSAHNNKFMQNGTCHDSLTKFLLGTSNQFSSHRNPPPFYQGSVDSTVVEMINPCQQVNLQTENSSDPSAWIDSLFDNESMIPIQTFENFPTLVDLNISSPVSSSSGYSQTQCNDSTPKSITGVLPSTGNCSNQSRSYFSELHCYPITPPTYNFGSTEVAPYTTDIQVNAVVNSDASSLSSPIKKTNRKGTPRSVYMDMNDWYIRDENGKKRRPLLHEFLRILLSNERYSSIAQYVDKEKGIFKFYERNKAAELWELVKARNADTRMTYDKLARAIRYYYNNGVIRQTPGRFTFRFDWASGFGSTWIPT